MVLEPFWSVIGYRFEPFWSKSLKTGMDFTETGVWILETRSENKYEFWRPSVKKSTGKLHTLV